MPRDPEFAISLCGYYLTGLDDAGRPVWQNERNRFDAAVARYARLCDAERIARACFREGLSVSIALLPPRRDRPSTGQPL